MLKRGGRIADSQLCTLVWSHLGETSKRVKVRERNYLGSTMPTNNIDNHDAHGFRGSISPEACPISPSPEYKMPEYEI